MMQSIQSVVDGVADRLGFPTVLEDGEHQLLTYSPHYQLIDAMREETILRRTVRQEYVTLFSQFSIDRQTGPFVVPADPDSGRLARLGVTMRYLNIVLGYMWVLLPAEADANDDARDVVRDAGAQLQQMLMAENRTRGRESDTALNVISPHAEERRQGVQTLGDRGGFESPRQLVVAVCLGPAWSEAEVRGSFWTANWANHPQHQVRSAKDFEGVALISVHPDGGDGGAGLAPALTRAYGHITQQRDGVALGVGVGEAVRPENASASYRHAKMAARAALTSSDLGDVVGWEDMGVYRFLSELPLHVLRSSIDQRLWTLIHESPLMAETLDKYLTHSGAVSAVADALHIHRTTLYYRLGRLRDKDGIDLDSAHDRITMSTGFAALRLLGMI